DEHVYERSRHVARYAALTLVGTFVLAGLWLWLGIDGYVITEMPPTDSLPDPLSKTVVEGEGAWLANYATYPIALLAPFAGILGAVGVYLCASRNSPAWGFFNSAFSIIGVIMTAGISLFPFVMPSSLNPSHSLTIWDSASSHLTLTIMFWATLVFVPIILFYTIWCYRALWGKYTTKQIRENSHSLY
ncbi:MAG TPA: cytochrome d ubiquinol oxidase subunit II, partial [Thiothrix sp.]|nr:cytochrome d ubiquinol oxidase subunit II [Thiothrix sp.]